MRRRLLPIATFLMLGISAASQQPPQSANAAIAGIVVNAVTGESLADVQVTLARTDLALGAFAQIFSAAPPNASEATLPGEMLAIMLDQIADIATSPSTDRARAQEDAVASALKAMPLNDIQEVIVTSERTVAVVRKSLQPVRTDGAGRFAFAAVEPGTYRMIFTAAGFAKLDYGQRIAEGKGTPVVVRAGESRSDLAMRLIPTGAVSGVIRNTNGQAVAGVPVELLRSTYSETGQMSMRRVASTASDDRGAYRVFYLTPGRYHVSAGESGSALPGPLRLLANPYTSPNRIQENHGLRYYPGVSESYRAATIDVRPGADITGVDVTLDMPQSYRIRGRVLDRRTGSVPGRPNIQLLPQEAPADAVGRATAPLVSYRPQDASFELANVSPGAYTLIATPLAANNAINISEDRAAAVVPIVVSNGDVDGIVLDLGNTGSITGRLRLDPSAPAQFTLSPFMQVYLTNADAALARALGNRGQQWALNPDGSFELSGMRYGDYYVSVRGLPPGFFLKEARLDQADVLNAPLRFSGTTTRVLDLVVSPNSGSIAGLSTTAAGQPMPGARVVTIPVTNRERTELFKAATADANGNYVISGISPGDYILAAWEAIEPWAFFDPELIREAEANSTRVRVSESSSATLNVTTR